MNRPIKFRIWDGVKMWFPNDGYELFILFGSDNYFSIQDHSPEKFDSAPKVNGDRDLCVLDPVENENTVIMQFTGLYDKNGKEIYEGDIFKHGDRVGSVSFSDGCFVFKYPGVSMTMRSHKEDEFEIIGNIHSNLELLK